MKAIDTTFKYLVVFALLLIASASTAQDKLRVGILMDNLASDRWNIDAKLLQNRFDELGIESSMKVANRSADTQLEQAKAFVDAGMDILVVIPVDGRKAVDIVTFAHENNVKVVAYDRPILDPNLDLYVAYDSYEVGQLMAKTALMNKPKGKYLLVNGPVADFNGVQARNGQKSVLKEFVDRGDIEIMDDIVLDSWREMTAFLAMQNLQFDLSELDCIIAASDHLAEGVIDALDGSGISGKVFVTGQDATTIGIENISKGVQHMTVLKPLPALATKAVSLISVMSKGMELNGVDQKSIGGFELPTYTMKAPLVITADNHAGNEDLIVHQKLRDAVQVN
ncbi:MAG: substrate-binding domain-containing protein [Cyclobacteriaceae bacterium]